VYRPLAALPLCLALAAAPASGQAPTADPAPAPAPAPKPAPGPQPAPAPKPAPAPVVLTVPDTIDGYADGVAHVEGGDPATFDLEIAGERLAELPARRLDTLRDWSFTGPPGTYKVTLYYTEGTRNRHVSGRTQILAPPAPAPTPQPSPAPQPAPSPGPIPAPEPVPVPPAPVPGPAPQPSPAPQPATPLEAAAQAYLRSEAASFRTVANQIRSGAVKRDGIPAAMKAARGPASKAVADQVNAAPDPAAALDAAAAAMEQITR
jgi:hypothetical protein